MGAQAADDRPSPDPALWRRAPAVVVLSLVLLGLIHPLSWPGQLAPLWYPSAGVVLALVAWFGPRAALLLLPASLLAALRHALQSLPLPAGGGATTAAAALAEAAYQAAVLAATWWLYARAEGDRGLRQPRSAVLFLLLTGAVLAIAATFRALAAWWFLPAVVPLREFGAWWLGMALGVIALAPPLLVHGTPWVRRKSAVAGPGTPTPTDTTNGPSSASTPAPRPGPGVWSWVEIGVLALGNGCLSVLLSLTPLPQEAGGWQLWGAPLLLVVWAGMRQGLGGATLVAAVGAVAALEVMASLRPPPSPAVSLRLQGNLLAQCATALLVAASSSWIRSSEARYRRVVSQIPVALYSTRVLAEPDPPGGTPRVVVTFVSPPAQALFGCPASDLLGPYERWLERVHPDDREVLLAAVRQIHRQSGPSSASVSCEYRLTPTGSDAGSDPESYRGPSGPRFRWLRDTLVPQHDEAGRLTGWEGMASDVTEQRVLADDLRRTTTMFHSLVGNLPAGIFFVSARSGRPIVVNARARQLLGQREVGSASLEHLPEVYRLHRPDGSPYPSEDLPVSEALRRGIVSMRDDIVVHRPDGRRVPLVAWAAPVALGTSGRTDAVVWVLEDLTDLRQAEAARHETEGRLRTVIESLAEGLVVQDRDGDIVDCNSAARDLLGLGPRCEGPAGLSAPFAPLLREDGTPLPADEHPARRVLRSGTPVRNFVAGLGPAGRPRWVLLNALPLAPRPGARPAGVVTTVVDITEHVHAQQTIRASEERYRGLIQSLPLMLVQFDRSGRITYMNPTGTTLSGYLPEEIRDPAVWRALVHPDDLAELEQAMGEAAAGRHVRHEVRYQAKNGQYRNCLCLWQPSTGDGLTALVVDLTRERRLEQELDRARRLELLGRLSSGIAHDFNNLLTVLMGLVDIAGAALPETHPVQRELGRMHEVGEQAAGLAQQILAFSKQRRAPLLPIELNHSLSRFLQVQRSLLPPEIEVDCQQLKRDLMVLGDEIQMQQVLMNLCLNAVSAMPTGGQLSLATELGRPPGQQGDWACVTVADTGVGMTPEVQRRIFEPFFSTRERGTGLGLAVVKQILTQFGGRIDVDSEPDRGTRVDIWLPLLEDTPARPV